MGNKNARDRVTSSITVAIVLFALDWHQLLVVIPLILINTFYCQVTMLHLYGVTLSLDRLQQSRQNKRKHIYDLHMTVAVA